jgi:two-component system, NarL family, sensor kinase
MPRFHLNNSIWLLILSLFIRIPSYLNANADTQKQKIQLQKDSSQIVNKLNEHIGKLPAIDSVRLDLLNFAKKNKEHYVLEDTYWYNLSKVYFMSGQLELSFASADSGLVLNKNYGNTYRSAKFYNLKASVFSYQQKYEEAIELFKTSLKILEDNNDQHTAALVKNNIANIFFGLSDYQSAYDYSQESYTQLKLENDTVNLPAVAGVAAISAFKIKKTERGKSLSEEALALSKKYSNPVGLIVANHSYGELYSLQQKYDSAIVYFNNSLAYSEQYRQAHFVMLNKIALQHSYLKLIDYKKSIDYGLQALAESNTLENQNTLYSINKNLGYAYAGMRNYGKAYNHMQLAHEYYIRSAGIENQKAINELLIQYDTQKIEKQLAEKKIENIENENKLIKRNQWIIFLTGLIIALVLLYIIYIRNQRQKLLALKLIQQEQLSEASIQAEEIERERIANELHDGMASSITGIKIKLENIINKQNETQLLPLVEQLKSLHEETRRISHNLMPLNINSTNWIDRLRLYCQENSHSKFRIIFSNNGSEGDNIDAKVAITLFRITQELIHNVQKHANTDFCHVQISDLENCLCISVEDEGIGFSPESKDGIGLSSIRKRLAILKGELEIDSKQGQGTLITVEIKR